MKPQTTPNKFGGPASRETRLQIVQPIKSIDELASFCKRRGFVFPGSELYGGLSGFWDYGPLGVELKNKIKADWWKKFVQDRDDVVGIDGAIVNNPNIWIASGHVGSFADVLVDCKRCGVKHRADVLINDVLGIPADSMAIEQMKEIIEKNNIRCPACKKGELTEPRRFNLLFKTHVGAVEGEKSTAYLRGETCQTIFVNFKNVFDTARMKLPFGIAQAGKAFRNEIAPRDFLFRSREFEQMELEFFVHPQKLNDCPEFEKIAKKKVLVLTASEQVKKSQKVTEMTFGELAEKVYVRSKWHAYWLFQHYNWFLELGISPENLRLREHTKDELSHYAVATFDIEYNFPFGWKELGGQADRGQFDLTQHAKFSKKDLSCFDEETKQRFIPYVAAEPSQGVDRAFLALLTEAYTVDGDRIVLKLKPKLAPVQVAVFPLLRNDAKLLKFAQGVHKGIKEKFITHYEESGNIGKSYRRQDEIGTPACITVDFDSLKGKDVTVRDRDTMKQKRVKVKELIEYLEKILQSK